MHEATNISASTPLDQKETSELIARLAEGGTHPEDHRATVKDLAEALDIDVNVVIEKLAEIRTKKEEKEVPSEAQKLAAALDEFQTKSSRHVTSKPLYRMIVVSLLLMLALLAGIFYNASAAQRKLVPPNITTMDKEGPAEELSRGP